MVDRHQADVNSAELAAAVKKRARELGFDLAGIATLEHSAHARFYEQWLEQGRHGSMNYLARPDAVARRLDPRVQQPELRSAIVVGLNYLTADDSNEAENGHGIIARYARGRDYHKVIKNKLLRLLEFLEQASGNELPAARAYVDTGPVFERELAQRAGLGWFGRNTMLINPKRGSFFFLGTLLVELDLPADDPFEPDHCGTCQACLEACPTGALLGRTAEGAPVMDATRCISYLTIEQRGPIPLELRPLIGSRIFGCDICQDVCPWNGVKFVTITAEKDLQPRAHAKTRQLRELIALSDVEFAEMFRGTPVMRAKRSGFLRNVAVAIGNSGDRDAVPQLAKALDDSDPLVRGHVAWALGALGGGTASLALRSRLIAESDPWVRDEIAAAINRINNGQY